MKAREQGTMRRSKGKGPKIIGFFVTILVMAGCAPTFRAHPQFQERVKLLKTVAVMPPSIKVYRLTAGGVKELMDEWTATAHQNVTRAIEAELGGQSGFAFKPFPTTSAVLEVDKDLTAESVEAELEETKALYRAVSASIMLHTYVDKHKFDEKLTNFDYSLGPEVEKLAKLANADALLFISGLDHISTGGRQALMFLGILLAGATGVYAGPAGGATSLSVALVDPATGAILWYNIAGSQGGHDLRDTESTADLVKQVFKDFPGRVEAK